MYPTISHLLFDLFGINIPLPIQTFGFWVAIAFILASWIISNELKRKEKEGFLSSTKVNEIIGESLTTSEIISSLLTGFFIGFKFIEALFHYTDLVNNPQDFILSTRGNLLGGILIASISFYLKWTENNKTKLATPKTIEKIVHPFELVGNMTMIAAVSGIIGAKIFHNLENMDAFLADPIGQLISFSGLTFYGGLIAGAVSVIWYAKKYKINTKHLSDSAAPGLMLAYGVGRIGCQMSGDGDWGIDNLAPKPEWMSFLPDWMWRYNFSHNVLGKIKYDLDGNILSPAGMTYIEDCKGTFWDPFCYQLANPVWPTAFYEVIMSLAIFGILWAIRRHIKVPGILFCIYLALNGLERFSIEKIRINTEYNVLGGITQAEIISSILVLIGLAGSIYLFRNSKKV